MATYAPGNALLYFESNHPVDVFDAIVRTDAWKIIDTASGTQPRPQPSRWLQSLIRWTGIGPVESVILARSQVAVVVTDLGITQEGETVRVKPEGALLIETHTSERRIRPVVEAALQKLAEITYGRPTSRRTNIDGVDLIEWTAPDNSRQIVATIVNSLIVIGNSEQAVRNCLAVILQHSHTLREEPEFERMRVQLAGRNGLTFGYVPAGNSSRLLSVGVPLVLGRTPGDSQFQRLITTNASKVLGSLGWSAHALDNGIEDRYLISLQPAIVSRLKPTFTHGSISTQSPLIPDGVRSVTYYKFENPAAVWQDLKAAASSQMDMLSAVVFSSLLKSALLSYGVDEPEKFLAAVKGDVLTLRMDQGDERPMLIAGVRDQERLKEIIRSRIGPNAQSRRVGEAEVLEDSSAEWAASLSKDVLVTGSSSDVRRYVENAKLSSVNDHSLRKMTFFVPLSSSANIVTYTNDSDRIRNFILAVLSAKEIRPQPSDTIERRIEELPYSATETSLGERGFERITRSPLGQFATLLPLLIPEKPGSAKAGE